MRVKDERRAAERPIDAVRPHVYALARLCPEVCMVEQIRKRMDELGMTQADLARRLGRPPAYVCDVMRGRRPNLTQASLVAIADALGCELAMMPRDE